VRIAVIGSGISGLVCARLLSREHDISVLEADARVGGHTNTVSVEMDGEHHHIDTGFIVYNERTYPIFSRLLADLDVQTMPTSMSFSVSCDRTGIEFCGTSLNGIFAQRRNLIRSSFLRMLKQIGRFNCEGAADLATVPDDQTVGEYLAENKYSVEFARHYLLPMGAAIWSCPYSDFERFPIRFILEFYFNHGLLSIRDRPIWRVIRGGSKEYVKRLIEPFADRIRTSCPVHAVRRNTESVELTLRSGAEEFDEVVFACHSDQALRLLQDADTLETEILSSFPYSSNSAVLHTDQSVLPRRRRAWSSWNYHIAREESIRPTVTYNMNILQRIESKHVFSVTLNEDQRIDPSKVLARFNYSHPLFTINRSKVQQRHDEVIRHRRTSYCGAYWRNGFHEDGVVSALAVCRKFGISNWTARTNDVSLHNTIDLNEVAVGAVEIGAQP
jgi:uncharacterized protein